MRRASPLSSTPGPITRANFSAGRHFDLHPRLPTHARSGLRVAFGLGVAAAGIPAIAAVLAARRINFLRVMVPPSRTGLCVRACGPLAQTLCRMRFTRNTYAVNTVIGSLFRQLLPTRGRARAACAARVGVAL